MEQLYNDALPCLQAVGPWWNDADRRILFCHLMSIFHFDADYLSSLPASVYTEFESTYRLSVSDIETEFGIFKKKHEGTNITCPCIRKISFSFGKFNQKVCFLCPYSGLYKNANLSGELRFLYHIMKSETRSLSDFTKSAECDLPLNSLFKSYFPIYVDDVLIEAYPYALIAEQFLNFPAGSFIKYPNESRQNLTANVHDSLEKLLHYIRIWKDVNSHFINASNKSITSSNKAIRRIEYENINTRSLGEKMFDRLFELLKRKNKYKPLLPTAYQSVVLKPVVDDFFKSTILAEPISYDTIDELYESPSKNDDFLFFLNNSNLIGDNFLDDKILDSKIETIETPTTLPLLTQEKDKLSVRTKKITSDQELFFSEFQEYYQLTSSDNICVLHEQPKISAESIFTSFFDNSYYFSIEPVEINNHKGFLFSNELKELLFFDVSYFGSKMIRSLSDMQIILYTSNTYHTGCCLFESGINKLHLHDVGIAYSLANHTTVKGQTDICKDSFPTCLFEYPKTYAHCLEKMSDGHRSALDTLELFQNVYSIDGTKIPFTGIDKLYRLENSCNVTYQYNDESLPLKTGLFLSIKAFSPNNYIQPETLKTLYMEICISLNLHTPFYKENIYLLNLNENGLLFYFIGSQKKLRKIRLILSACCRRAFSYLSSKENPISFEEQSHIYECTNK